MRVAIVHYHLQPGGVTHVIAGASRQLSNEGIPHIVLTGEEPNSDSDVPSRTIRALAYRDGLPEIAADQLLDQMRNTAREALGGDPDLWHFHNHSLGKNRLIPEVVELMANSGEKLFLQIHDLAEDRRPGNFRNLAQLSGLYPVGPQIHYAFVNSWDRQQFVDAGLANDRAILVPNPISVPSILQRSTSETPLLLAPIRGIRRKNLGELLLLAKYLKPGARIATTQAPLQPKAVKNHAAWERVARELNLPIQLAVVGRDAPSPNHDSSFMSWVQQATHFITTSIAEGFALPFLESIKLGKPLLGRDIPKITSDHGVNFEHLYHRILVPTSHLDLKDLLRRIVLALENTHRLYQRPLTAEVIDRTFESLTAKDQIDFGNLPESMQCEILHQDFDLKVETRSGIFRLQPWLDAALESRTATCPWNETPSRLTEHYRRLNKHSIEKPGFLDREQILDAYLRTESFHFLMSDPPSESSQPAIRACIFDIYGTLVAAKSGGVRVDLPADDGICEVCRRHGFSISGSPTTQLAELVQKHHALSKHAHPEVDLREILRQFLNQPSLPLENLQRLLTDLEDFWHPGRPMDGAGEMLRNLANQEIALGLLSNAQANTLELFDRCTNGAAEFFRPELTLLSYQHGIAKPSPELFDLMVRRLNLHGITPAETLFLGNDPIQDILPAAKAGFRTALFVGHPDSIRSGECLPDFTLKNWADLGPLLHKINAAATDPKHTNPRAFGVPTEFS